MSEHIEEKKTFEPLNSVSVLDLRQDIVDLIHNIDKDENFTYLTIPDLVDGVIGKYIDLEQPTSATNASWIETALDEAFDIVNKEGILIRPMYRIPTGTRRFQIGIDWKIYRLENVELPDDSKKTDAQEE